MRHTYILAMIPRGAAGIPYKVRQFIRVWGKMKQRLLYITLQEKIVPVVRLGWRSPARHLYTVAIMSASVDEDRELLSPGICAPAPEGDSRYNLSPSVFLETFHDSNFDFQRFNALRCCHEALQPIPNGLSVLEYGVGPTLHETFIIAAKASKVILADYSEANRNALRSWFDNDPEAFDWLPYFKRTVRELEIGDDNDVSTRVENIRRTVKAVVHCDLTQDPPIESGYDCQYDLVSSSFCICVAVRTHQEYREGIAKLARSVKPGGVLLICECDHEKCHLSTCYFNNIELNYVAVTSDFVLKAFRDAGFSEVTIRYMELDPNHPFRIQRPERVGYFHVKGIKKK